MSVVSTSAPAPAEVIAFTVAGQEYCVDIMNVREIRGWTAATPIPQSPAYVRGVINLRGAVLPILDMAARLGLKSETAEERHVIIVVWIEGRLVGLEVDAVCDILTPPEGLQRTPEMTGQEAGFVDGLLTINERMIALINLGQVMPGPDGRSESRAA